MTYEMYQTIFWHAGVLTIIFAVGDVLLFVILKIPKVIGQLSGRTARKGIADIWKKNIQTRGRCYKSCAENQKETQVDSSRKICRGSGSFCRKRREKYWCSAIGS